MIFPPLFHSLLNKLGIHIESHHNDSHSRKNISLNFNFGGTHNHLTSPEDLRRYLSEHPVALPEDINIEVSDTVKVSENIEASITPQGNLQMTKITDSPSKEELELVLTARGSRTYNSIENVRIGYDETGNIKTLQWTES